jgi:insertion element IS1 protein InsB
MRCGRSSASEPERSGCGGAEPPGTYRPTRGTATLLRLWRALPKRYRRHTRYFTDAWRAYPQVLPAPAHVVGKSGTWVVEALNGKLRHRCGVLVRRSRSFSKCRVSHYNRIKIAIDHHNSQITLN